ncbi:MAG: hypothetical protein ACERKV_08245 [Clostridiaceae bacterium]
MKIYKFIIILLGFFTLFLKTICETDRNYPVIACIAVTLFLIIAYSNDKNFEKDRLKLNKIVYLTPLLLFLHLIINFFIKNTTLHIITLLICCLGFIYFAYLDIKSAKKEGKL